MLCLCAAACIGGLVYLLSSYKQVNWNHSCLLLDVFFYIPIRKKLSFVKIVFCNLDFKRTEIDLTSPGKGLSSLLPFIGNILDNTFYSSVWRKQRRCFHICQDIQWWANRQISNLLDLFWREWLSLVPRRKSFWFLFS